MLLPQVANAALKMGKSFMEKNRYPVANFTQVGVVIPTRIVVPDVSLSLV